MKLLWSTTLITALLCQPTLAFFDCAQLGALAARIMDERQESVPMSYQMELLDSVAVPAGSVSLLREYVVRAYSTPAYGTEEYQTKAIADFRNEVELECYTEVGE